MASLQSTLVRCGVPHSKCSLNLGVPNLFEPVGPCQILLSVSGANHNKATWEVEPTTYTKEAQVQGIRGVNFKNTLGEKSQERDENSRCSGSGRQTVILISTAKQILNGQPKILVGKSF